MSFIFIFKFIPPSVIFMDKTAENLVKETCKWLEKIKNLDYEIKEEYKNIKSNIEAYIKDAEHFLNKKMYIEAFESVVWAWAWIEISEYLGIAKIKR